MIRIINYLSHLSIFGRNKSLEIFIDSRIRTIVVGLALGDLLLRFPWKVICVMLDDTVLEGYKKHEAHLLSEFEKLIMGDHKFDFDKISSNLVQWVDYSSLRK